MDSIQDEKDRLVHDLAERVKELRCLHGLSKLAERPDNSLEDVVEGTLDLIPASWQFPEHTCARIVLGELVRETPTCRETPWELRSDITVHGEALGFVQVSYTEEMPTADEGPFLKEERYLLDTIAERLGRIAEHKEDEAELNKLRMAVQQSADGIAITDLEGFIEFANSAWATIHGYRSHELPGKHVRLLHTGEQYHEDVVPFIDQVLRAGLHQSEMDHVSRDGRVFPVLITSAVLRDGDDRPLGLVWISHDISERKQAEREIITAKEMWDRSFESLSVGMFIIDKDFNVIRCNQAMASIVGVSPEEIIGMKCCEVVHGLPEPPSGCATCAALENREAVRDEFFEPHLGKYLEVAVDPILDENGRLLYAVHLISDISARKNVEKMLERANAELEGYAHTVAHDLKNPLATAKMASLTLRKLAEGGDDSRVKADEVMDIIETKVDLAISLVDDLLALAETGQVPTDVTEVDVGDTVHRVLEERSEDIEVNDVDVVVDKDLGTVRGNPVQIYQLFSNIIGNAIEHCDSSKPLVRVKRLDGESEEHRYIVSDNGSGIPEQMLEEIFIPFKKGEHGGTGIGLSIVQKVVELYGGDIRAYNDGGAVFEFHLKDLPSR